MDHLDRLLSLLSDIRGLLVAERQSICSPVDLVELEQRHQQRQQLRALLVEARQSLRQLEETWLPSLPSGGWICWARALLHQPNLLILEVDTTGLGPGAELLRVLLLRVNGVNDEVAFDQLVRPRAPEAQLRAALDYNGIPAHELAIAPSLEEVWPAFCEASRGSLLLSWHWEWDLAQLNRAGDQLNVARLPLLGIDLQEPARRYFALDNASLWELCHVIDEPLPRPATALARARGQLAVLRAMAEGRLGPRSSQAREDQSGAAEDSFEDLDDTQPF